MYMLFHRVQVALEGLPGEILAGELARGRLVLTNAGPAPLRALRCTAAGPSLHLAPDAGDLAGDALSRLAGGQGAGHTETLKTSQANQLPCCRAQSAPGAERGPPGGRRAQPPGREKWASELLH